MKVKNVGQLRKIIENLSDDFEIEMRIRRKLTDEELKKIADTLILTIQSIQLWNLTI